MKEEIKDFKDVQVGDAAYDCNVGEFEGIVLAKGKFRLLVVDYQSTWGISDLDEDEVEEVLNADCVAIGMDPNLTMEKYSSNIFLYDYDPSSVECYK